MQPSKHVTVSVDLNVVRANAGAVAARAGVPVIAVVKADAYGLGIQAVARAVADVAGGFCVFSLFEAAEAGLWKLAGKPILAIGPPGKAEAQHFLAAHVQPAVSTVEDARRLRATVPVLAVDTGQQRFAAPPEQFDAVLRAGLCREAFTHAARVEQARALVGIAGGRGLRLHAAGSSLLHEPEARLDAVRPGLALYRGAARVSTRLVEARDARGPAGYSGFTAERVGVIPCGYFNGFRSGVCLVNGRRCRVPEVGMQSAFVALAPGDAAGDEVVLLGDGLSEAEVAAAWGTGPQEVLVRLCAAGVRGYVGEAKE